VEEYEAVVTADYDSLYDEAIVNKADFNLEKEGTKSDSEEVKNENQEEVVNNVEHSDAVISKEEELEASLSEIEKSLLGDNDDLNKEEIEKEESVNSLQNEDNPPDPQLSESIEQVQDQEAPQQRLNPRHHLRQAVNLAPPAAEVDPTAMEVQHGDGEGVRQVVEGLPDEPSAAEAASDGKEVQGSDEEVVGQAENLAPAAAEAASDGEVLRQAVDLARSAAEADSDGQGVEENEEVLRQAGDLAPSAAEPSTAEADSELKANDGEVNTIQEEAPKGLSSTDMSHEVGAETNAQTGDLTSIQNEHTKVVESNPEMVSESVDPNVLVEALADPTDSEAAYPVSHEPISVLSNETVDTGSVLSDPTITATTEPTESVVTESSEKFAPEHLDAKEIADKTPGYDNTASPSTEDYLQNALDSLEPSEQLPSQASDDAIIPNSVESVTATEAVSTTSDDEIQQADSGLGAGNIPSLATSLDEAAGGQAKPTTEETGGFFSSWFSGSPDTGNDSPSLPGSFACLPVCSGHQATWSSVF
jgi:hypothetical protein